MDVAENGVAGVVQLHEQTLGSLRSTSESLPVPKL